MSGHYPKELCAGQHAPRFTMNARAHADVAGTVMLMECHWCGTDLGFGLSLRAEMAPDDDATRAALARHIEGVEAWSGQPSPGKDLTAHAWRQTLAGCPDFYGRPVLPEWRFAPPENANSPAAQSVMGGYGLVFREPNGWVTP